MERIPRSDKFIGTANERNTAAFLEAMQKNTLDLFAERQREKTEEEKKFIRAVNQITSAAREKYGAPPVFSVEEDDVYVLNHDEWVKAYERCYGGSGSDAMKITGIAIASMGKIFIHHGLGTESRARFIHDLVHEMIHIKSFVSQRVDKDDVVSEDRTGLDTHRKREQRFFRIVNEALTDELTEQLIRENAEQLGFNDQAVNETIASASLRFGEYRKWLRDYIRDLAASDTKSSSRDASEIYEMFYRAMFTGNMLPIGKLIDKNKGKGSFRSIAKISELDPDLAGYLEDREL